MKTVGLFAGIGGVELGLERAGHQTVLLCEIDEAAKAVLHARFPTADLVSDICELDSLPAGTELLAGGFPCQDLSQAGQTKGIQGLRSGLVTHVFRLLETHRTPWVLLENVPFMLQLSQGRAMEYIVDEFERLGYKWAYRVVDSRAFGLPQRRQRVYFLASLSEDPRRVIFADDAGLPDESPVDWKQAHGFYWTEGKRGLGWATNAIPTLKGGSTIGIPSAPAIILPTGEVVTPHIRDAERMQGFDPGWTEPVEHSGMKAALRWKLVGNAVTVNAAEWIGHRLQTPLEEGAEVAGYALDRTNRTRWPNAAWNLDGKRFVADVSAWPFHQTEVSLNDFLEHPPKPLSIRATTGFLSRARAGSLRFPEGFFDRLDEHLERMGNGHVDRQADSSEKFKDPEV